MTEISNTVDILRKKYETENQEVSFLRSKIKLKNEPISPEELSKDRYKMEPREFGVLIKTILEEKLW